VSGCRRSAPVAGAQDSDCQRKARLWCHWCQVPIFPVHTML